MAMVPTSLATSSPPSWEHLAGRNPTCVSQIHMTSDRCDDVCLCEFLGFCIDRVEVSVLLACVTVSLGEWCPLFCGSGGPKMLDAIHPVMRHHILEEQRHVIPTVFPSTKH